jgi:hypothetical protein
MRIEYSVCENRLPSLSYQNVEYEKESIEKGEAHNTHPQNSQSSERSQESVQQFLIMRLHLLRYFCRGHPLFLFALFLEVLFL